MIQTELISGLRNHLLREIDFLGEGSIIEQDNHSFRAEIKPLPPINPFSEVREAIKGYLSKEEHKLLNPGSDFENGSLAFISEKGKSTYETITHLRRGDQILKENTDMIYFFVYFNEYR